MLLLPAKSRYFYSCPCIAASSTALKSVGAEATPTLTSLLVLYTHVKTGRWASVMPAQLAKTLGLADTVRSIPTVNPVVTYSIGLVVPHRTRIAMGPGSAEQREGRCTASGTRDGEERALARVSNHHAATAIFRVLRASRGSETQTTVPVPSFERSRIDPPCRLVSDLAIARPSPDP
jgi:hypothetical protein